MTRSRACSGSWGCRTQPTPQTLRLYADFLAAGFEPRTIELAAIQQNGKNRHRFEDVEKLLEMWARLGLYRADAAEAYVQRQRQLQAELMELLRLAGSDRTPNLAEIEMYQGWKERFSEEMLRLAAQIVTGGGRPMSAMEKLLERWTPGRRLHARAGARAARGVAGGICQPCALLRAATRRRRGRGAVDGSFAVQEE